MKPKLGQPLSPLERASAIQHIGGFSMKRGHLALGISHHTYNSYIKRARVKLGVTGQGIVGLERALLKYMGVKP